MNKNAILLILFVAFFACSKGQSCSLACNITSGYICPNTAQWKANANIYSDVETMEAIGYKKDNQGCWKLTSSSGTKTITGNKSYLSRLYSKLKGVFSVTKKGF